MNFNSKLGEEEFSTNEGYNDLKGYSSRHRKIKHRHSSVTDFLPHKLQKAAITIQRFWRNRLSTRRLFYEQLLEELIYDNQITSLKNKKQKQYLDSLEHNIQFHSKINGLKVNKKIGRIEGETKEIIRKCIGMTFRFQKKMLTKEQLSKLLSQKQDLKKKIELLREQKKELRNYLTGEYQEEQQILLRQIREANSLLLKTTTEKNNLKQKVTEKLLKNSQQY